MQVDALNGPQQAASTDTFLLRTATLNNFADDTVLVRFSASRGFGTDNQGDIAIDDFGFQEAPTCPDPAQLAVSTRSTQSITLDWTAVNATSWDVQYGPAGAALGAAGKTTTNVSSHPYEVTGLSPGTTYRFWVREVCSSTDQSNWIGPLEVPTHCSVVQAPFTETFDGTGWVPGTGVYNTGSSLGSCWWAAPAADTLPAGPYAWGVRDDATTTGVTGPNADYSGSGNYLYAEASMGAPDQIGYLESPLISLDTLLKPRVQFYYHMWGAFVNELQLHVWVDSLQTWQTYWTAQGNQGNAWQFVEVDLGAFAGDTIALRWAAKKGNGSQGDIAIDQLVVDDAPLCPDPSDLAVLDITLNSASFTWTTGGSSTWNLLVGTAGFSPSASNLVNISTTTAVWSGLQPGTTYDAYVRDTCGAFGASSWVGPLTFTTLCAPFAAPYVENFDSTSWATGANQQPGTIDGCWQRSDTTTYFFKAGPPTNHSAGTGPSSDHTSGSGGYAFTEANTGFAGGNLLTTDLTSPFIDASTLTTPELTFWYHMFGPLINKLEVHVRPLGGNWAKVTTLTGQQQSAATDPWKEAVVDLSSYSGDTLQLKFVGYRLQGGQNQVDISIDDVDVHEAPTCPKPSNLLATSVGSNQVILEWTTGGAAQWQVEWGVPGHTVGSGTFVGTSSNPFTLTGLSANTAYEMYVRDSCGTGDVSEWVGPLTIQTLCGTVVAPWTEDFEGVSFVASSGALDPCFTSTTSTTYFWETGTGATPTANTGPTGDHSSGSGQYVFAESAFGFNGDTETELVTSLIDLDTLSTPELRFWWHGAGSNIDQLEVAVRSGSTWTTELTIDASSATLQSTPADAWQEGVVDLTSYAGDTVQVRFTAFRTTAFGLNAQLADWAIDDLSIDNAPTCLQPSSLAATGSSTTSITLGWTTGGAAQWQIEYGPAGFTPGSGTVVAASSNPFTVNGLSPSTNYDFYVRDSCGATDVSQWAGPALGTTACGTATAPYFENFETDFVGGVDNAQGHNIGATISACWTRTTTDTDSNYVWGGRSGGTATAGTGPGADHTTGFGSYVYAEASFSTGTPSATLVTPAIDLSALTVPELHFWYHVFAQVGPQGTLKWSIQNTSTGVWTDLDSVSGTQGNQWIEVVQNLGAYANETVKIKFTATKAGNGTAPQQGDIAIDDVSIVEAPSCPDPSALVAQPTGLDEVSLSWTTGGATAWQVEYGTAGFTPGTGTVLAVPTNPFTVTGLTAGTAYDFYLRDSCGATDLSNWIGPVSATTFTCTNGCVYTLELTDTYGDGWTAGGFGNNFHQLAVTNGSAVTNYTLANGTSVTYTFNVCDGDTLVLSFTDAGQWESECGFVLTGPGGAVLASVAGAANAGQTGAMTAGVKYSGSANCTQPCPTPVPVFTWTAAGLNASFDATTSQGTSLTYSWNFGDGGTASGATPTHTYGADGTYTVVMTATDTCGQVETVSDTLQVCAPLVPQVSYTQSAFVFNFDATGNPGATSATWNFGDGNSGVGFSIAHTYATSGTFTVQLLLENSCGEQVDTSFAITVCVVPTAQFNASILSQSGGGLTVQFDASSSVGATSYFWQFGDGNTNTTSAFPVHTYTVPTTAYPVTLTVYNACGDSQSITKSLGDALSGIGIASWEPVVFELFPNPSTGLFVLRSNQLLDGSVEVHNALGQRVFQTAIQGQSEVTLNLEELAAGTYLVRLVHGTQVGQQQLQILK